MAKTKPKSEATETAPAEKAGRVPLRGRRDLWQIPVLGIALVLLGLGIAQSMRKRPATDFSGALAAVEQLLATERYEEAVEILNGPVLSSMDDPAATPAVLSKVYELRGDAVFLLQRAKGLDVPANHAKVMENYRKSREYQDRPYDDTHLARMAETQLALGDVDGALANARRITTNTARRHEIFKKLIDKGLEANATALNRARAMDLLAELRVDPTISEQLRIWTVTRQTRISLRAGFPEEAIRRLLPEIQRLPSRLDPSGAEFFLLLGEAYTDLGHFDDARTHIEHAATLLDPSAELGARAQVLLGRIDLAQGDPEQAADRLSAVAERFGTTDVGLAAWLMKAEAEAELGRYDLSIAAYENVVNGLGSRIAGHDAPTAADVDASLSQRHKERFEAGDLTPALHFAALVERLYRSVDPPAEALNRLARTHEALGSSLMAEVPRTTAGAVDLAQADPATLEQARHHLMEASRYFERHAKAIVVADPEVAADSLWVAGDSMDRAGDLGEAVRLYGEYVEARADDPRALQGYYRLARAKQAMGDYENAAAGFERILLDNPTSREAYASYVPLANTYLLLQKQESAERAEGLLMRVIEGRVFGPEAPEFREALIDLGEVYRQLGRFPDAVRRLEESLERFPDLREDPRFLASLADTRREASDDILRQLESAMPQSERYALREIRGEHLTRALELYESVLRMYQDRADNRLSDLDRTILRNAFFYRGDCAFDLGEHEESPEGAAGWFERAIRSYDAAAQRYANEPASLVAMVQIVNCYAALGKWREVRTAHQRAKTRLEELDPSAWENSQAPMDRRYWERWLAASVELDRLASGSP